MNSILQFLKKIIPAPLFRALQPYYHLALAYVAAVWYLFPSRKLFVIGVTGTNGKTTTVHMLTKILQNAGYAVASVSSLRFQIKDDEWTNDLKMTMPGRFRLQRFLSQAYYAGCTHVVMEVTSEGIKQYRHAGVSFALAILTNMTPEHIESHGGFEKYRATKARLFYCSPIHILNQDDANADFFSKIPAKKRILYSADNLSKDVTLSLPGRFNKENASAAYSAACELGADREVIKKTLREFGSVPGRLEFVQRDPFSVIIDYAHTPDALTKVYETIQTQVFSKKRRKLICVLGAAGGGRDVWKRAELGNIAAKMCDHIIVTNEDPYDEDPKKIIDDVARGAEEKLVFMEARKEKSLQVERILDRSEAIRHAIISASQGDCVIITGKGAEPWLMGAHGKKIPWDDRAVARDALATKRKT